MPRGNLRDGPAVYNLRVLPSLEPMRLARRPQPFDHPDWLYEIKFDGFRAVFYVCGLRSRSFLTAMPVWKKEKLLVKQLVRREMKAISDAGNRDRQPEVFFSEHRR